MGLTSDLHVTRARRTAALVENGAIVAAGFVAERAIRRK
jgi:hypothetical protein